MLALFSHVGFDAEVATELTLIAQPLGLDERQLRDAARALEPRGLLTRQGRYRAVGPQPIAVYLASQAWSQLGEAIVGELLSVLDPDMTERLFRRAAEIGDADTSRLAVERAMAPGGIVGSWESLLKDGNAKLLVHLAILAPTVTTVHLERLANNATLDELASYRSIRRDLYGRWRSWRGTARHSRPQQTCCFGWRWRRSRTTRTTLQARG